MNDSLVIVARQQILRRICDEYLEMPGLRLTCKQAQRLWGIDEQTCPQLLESLTQEKFLYRSDDGMYARLTAGAVTAPPRRALKAGQVQAQRGTASPPDIAAASGPTPGSESRGFRKAKAQRSRHA